MIEYLHFKTKYGAAADVDIPTLRIASRPKSHSSCKSHCGCEDNMARSKDADEARI